MDLQVSKDSRINGTLVETVGIGLKATLKIRNLLILLNAKNAKNTGFAQVRHARGTREFSVRGRLAQVEADVRQTRALESSLLSSGFRTNLAGGETEVVN